MNLGDQAGRFIVAIIIIAILYVLLRPGSPGVDYIKSTSGALANLVKAVTGQDVPANTTSSGGGTQLA